MIRSRRRAVLDGAVALVGTVLSDAQAKGVRMDARFSTYRFGK